MLALHANVFFRRCGGNLVLDTVDNRAIEGRDSQQPHLDRIEAIPSALVASKHEDPGL